MAVQAYAAHAAGESLRPFTYEPAPLRPHEIEVAITHCGLCHSDLHLIDDDWGDSEFPLVPGHEIVGTVSALGEYAAGFESGQRVGIGWQCGSCMRCDWCVQGEEACCPDQQATCVGHHGGFADRVRVDSRFAYALPDTMRSEHAAPLLCAGHTVYTPLHRYARPNHTIGVIGIGGLGHLALQFAHALGCRVVAFSSSPSKELEARRFGAHEFIVTSDRARLRAAASTCDLILNTVSAPIDWPDCMAVLRPKGTLVILGGPPGDIRVPVNSLIDGDRGIRGSATGSRHTMREMLRFAARHNIAPKVETMPMSEANAALDRLRENKPRFRIVLER